jgi:K+-sensing histidine kinase KdpD
MVVPYLHKGLGRLGRTARSLAGILLSGLASLGTVWVFEHASHRDVAPLIFLLVLILIARWFGTLPAFIGTLISGAVFAWCLFPPIGSVQVADVEARRSIVWMILGGVVLSDFIPAIKRSRDQQRCQH